MKKKIHINQHKIRSNKKNNTVWIETEDKVVLDGGLLTIE
jgi:translation initiation factor IF-1